MDKINKKFQTEEVCFFAALCMFFSSVEMAIPKPLPFLRLGLANIPLLLALKLFSGKEFFLLVALKVLVQALVSGTLLSYIFLFSICGTFASASIMYGLYRLTALSKRPLVTNIGISTAGAFGNNLVQILLCYLMLFGQNTIYIICPMLFFGLTSGIVLGIVVNLLENKSDWVRLMKERNVRLTNGSLLKSENEADSLQAGRNEEKLTGKRKSSKSVEKLTNGSKFILFFFFILLILFTVLFSSKLWVKWTGVFLLLVWNVIQKKKIRILPSVITVVSVTLMTLLQPSGKVLFSLGRLNVTLGALETGLARSSSLVALVFASKLLVNKKLRLPGIIGVLVDRIFAYFGKITAIKVKPLKKGWIKDTENQLCESILSMEEEDDAGKLS